MFKMDTTICKELVLVTWLSLLFTALPTRCDVQHLGSKSNFTRDSNNTEIRGPFGLDRINPLTLPRQQNPPAGSLGQEKSSFVTLPLSKETKLEQAEEEKVSGNPASLLDTSNMEVDEAETLKKNAKVNLETRTNSSSSTSLESGIIPSLAKLFNAEDSAETDFNMNDGHENNSEDNQAQESSVHEHVERYQLHQSSEEDDDIPLNAHFPQKNQPVSVTPAGPNHSLDNKNPKFRGSVVVSSSSFPIRIGPSSGISNRRNDQVPVVEGIRIQKPIPVVRHEESILIEESIGEDENLNRQF